MSLRRISSAVALAMALSGPAWAQTNEPGQDRPRPGTAEAIAELAAETNGAARVGLHRATGAARFVRLGAPGRAALAPPALLQIPRENRMRDFIARHGDVFGIRDAATELFESRVTTDALENTHVTYQQRHRGVPVFAGELRAHFNNAGELTVVNGTFIPDLDVDPTPAHDAAAAANVAVNKVEGEKGRTGLRAAQSDLVVFRAGLAKGVAGRNHLAWRVEVGNGGDVREFVFIDAHTAKFIEQFTGIHDALNRRAFDGQGSTSATPPNYPGTPFWVEGNPFPTASTEANNMILASGETHSLFMNAFGRDSFDGLGATMDAIFNRGNACPNASWNGTFISFCPGLTSDDVTGHEWAHAYTEYTHNLIYAWQPGALNESYSDIFGETVDRINARGGDTPFTARTAGSCSTFTPPGTGADNSVRWLLGEDDTGPLAGALRDMWNPTCYGDPGKVTDTQYRCDPAFTDQGGVHSNSGVPNHAFALLVDGGTYNSLTVNPIGLTKAVHIYFRAMNVYQSLASDFLDHADSIEQSCTDLTGVNLADLSTGAPSGEIISASDCTQVASAVLAVQLRTPVTTCSNFVPLLAKNPPAVCEAGSTQTTALLSGFESGPAGWTVAHTAVVPADFTPRDWAISSSLPDGRAGSAFFGVDFTGGTCGPGGDESGVLQLTSPTVALPLGAAPRMTFEHWVGTEADWDGGNVKVSVNGGPFTLIARAHYTFNPYNDTALNTTGQGNTNPLQGQAAFSGADGGSVDGSWGRSHVNLAPYANPGDNVQLRFDLGTDGCGGTFGWYIDDVSVHACVFTGPEISVFGNAISITDGDATPSATDHTNFGSADIAGGTVVRTFTVENVGAAPLTLGALTIGGPHAADFTLTLAPTSPVAAPGTTTFQITFDPSALGPRSATVTLVNDDPDESPFDFSIEGIGFTPVTATVQTVTEVEGNGTTATAMALPLPSNAGVKVRAKIYPAGDLDFYSFTATAGDRIYAATMTSGSPSQQNSQLTLLASDGTTVVEFDEDNGSFAGTSSSIAGAVIPSTGTYYVKVNEVSPTGTERGYDLYLQTRTGAPTPETESNDTPGTANTGITWASGNRNPAVASEQDWYAMTLAAGDTVFLNLDVDPERDGITWNGRLGLALFGDAGNQILVVDDSGASDTRPSEALFLTVKEAGTYFAFVDSATAATGGPTATYHLNMTVFPRVPVGVNTTTYTSTDVPKAIGPGAGLVSSTITVPGNPRIALIRVTVDLNHAVMGQVDVHLRSPAGNDIGLFTDIGAAAAGGQTQMNTTFADEAAVPPLFTVLKGLIVKPEFYRLYWLNGEDAGGTWTLDIRDDVADANGGTLNGWSIEISEMPALPIGATIFSTDFETDDAGFTHSGTGDEWERGLPATAATNTAGNAIAAFSTANSGTNAWKTDLDGTYDAFSDQDLFSPNIDLSAINGVVTLSWAQRYQMESASFDHAYVEVQEVGGGGATRKVWEWLDATMSDSVGSPAENIGASAGWGLMRADISDFAGKTIRVRFHLDGDDSFQFAGLAIDDFSVTAIFPPTVTTPTSSAVTATTATLGGNVTSDGGSAITERGVVYSVTTTNADPLIGGTGVTKLTTSGTTGVFTVGATGLSPADYSFKAYATNAAGTGYTTVATFIAPPTISIGDASVMEGNAGTTNAVFTVTLSGPSSQIVTVTAATSNLSATSGSDYTATGPTVLTFAPGVVTQQFLVPITGDTSVESDETFTVTLSAPANGEILDGQATGTITNDDGAPPSRVFVSESGSDANDCAIQTTPCRNLAAAVGQVSIDGEVIFLTPGEYDTAPILIGKGVKISAGSGTVAFIRQPITINAPGGRVSLRGLTLKGSGSGTAATLVAADSVSLEEVSFDRWSIALNLLNASASRITVANSTFAANAFGITDQNAGAASLISITGTRFDRNSNTAMDIYGATTTVSESAFVGNLNGIFVGPGSADIRDSEFWGTGNGTLVSFPGGALSLSRSHVFGNVIGLVGNGGLTVSFGNNVIRGNGTDTAGGITTVPEQ